MELLQIFVKRNINSPFSKDVNPINDSIMETKELKFKTNLNCSNCVAKVTEDLNSASGVEKWEVDTDNPDKILSIDSTGISSEEVIEIIEKKGFKAEELN